MNQPNQNQIIFLYHRWHLNQKPLSWHCQIVFNHIGYQIKIKGTSRCQLIIFPQFYFLVVVQIAGAPAITIIIGRRQLFIISVDLGVVGDSGLLGTLFHVGLFIQYLCKIIEKVKPIHQGKG